MKCKFNSQADFKRALNALCVDLGQAIDYFTLFNNLMKAKQAPTQRR
jgi:hypothetical protein